jgi:phosphate transport system substrate-binding protein
MPLGRRQRVATVGAAAVATALSLAACSSSSSSSTPPASGGSGSAPASSASSSSAAVSGTLNASGSTFQLTFQQTAIAAYKQVDPSLTVNYGGGGSGKGVTDLASGTVQYAGSDSPISTAQEPLFSGKTVLYFPVVIGPITLSYNLSGLSKPLQLSAPVVAQIFEGKITAWNNSAIATDNPGVTLPSTAIALAVRSDSSGTTNNFSKFLAAGAGSAWTLSTGSIIKWPATAHAGSGNGGVAQIIKNTPGAIGYVDYATAHASELSFASVKNSAGVYVAPSPTSASAAASQVTVKPNLTFSAIWAPGAASYPITYQSWDLVYETQSSASTAKALQAWIGYLIGSGGQNLLPTLGYAKVPANIDTMAQAQLSKIGM